jgi:hypothetical protein
LFKKRHLPDLLEENNSPRNPFMPTGGEYMPIFFINFSLMDVVDNLQ